MLTHILFRISVRRCNAEANEPPATGNRVAGDSLIQQKSVPSTDAGANALSGKYACGALVFLEPAPELDTD
ncbi:MAG: hypothetical protein KC582_01990 [Candidatus Magasanikbacteria bacterium]|nr:hypothetical protein [Candidatus Magasanikbacteria bacterium]MCA9391000.1 hypothetical protein [Candidatus Magasanikbacteria bacterium]HPF95620.1 hypothetical protein [bacterium]